MKHKESDLTIYNYKDYRIFLKSFVSSLKRSRGMLKVLAGAAKCQASYFSQVLAGNAHLTPEQAYDLSLYLDLTAHGRDYFVKLVDWQRAGTERLKTKLYEELEKIRSAGSEISVLLNQEPKSSQVQHAQYYRHWLVTAIHFMTSISQYQTPEAIAERLNLRRELVENILLELAEQGLVVRRDKHWHFAVGDTHLNRNSPLLPYHHQNWRGLAVERSLMSGTDESHFTGVYSIAKVDLTKLREALTSFIQSSDRLARASHPETLVCLTCDLFEV